MCVVFALRKMSDTQNSPVFTLFALLTLLHLAVDIKGGAPPLLDANLFPPSSSLSTSLPALLPEAIRIFSYPSPPFPPSRFLLPPHYIGDERHEGLRERRHHEVVLGLRPELQGPGNARLDFQE